MLIGSSANVDRLWIIPQHGRKYHTEPVREAGGFVVKANAQALALGFHTTVATTLGDDEAGDFFEESLKPRPTTRRIVRSPSASTGTAEIVVCGDDRTILFDGTLPRVCWRPPIEDPDVACAVDYALIGGTLHVDTLTTVLKSARAYGRAMFVNPTRFTGEDNVRLDGVKLVQVSRGDASNFGLARDAPRQDIANHFLHLGAENVVITDSAEDVLGLGKEGVVQMRTVPIRRSASPVGAGDTAFVGHVAGVIAGLDMPDWLNVGILAGAYFVQHSQQGTWRDLKALNRKWPPERRSRR